jgi:hypothetical protein
MKMFTGNAILPKLDGIYRFLRWVLGGIFIYSGTTKLLAPKTFAVLIEAYGLVPDGMILPVAVILPFLEVVGGPACWSTSAAAWPLLFTAVSSSVPVATTVPPGRSSWDTRMSTAIRAGFLPGRGPSIRWKRSNRLDFGNGISHPISALRVLLEILDVAHATPVVSKKLRPCL